MNEDKEKTPPYFPPGALRIESLDIEAQGIAHREDGKVVFIEGALPFEQRLAHLEMDRDERRRLARRFRLERRIGEQRIGALAMIAARRFDQGDCAGERPSVAREKRLEQGFAHRARLISRAAARPARR